MRNENTRGLREGAMVVALTAVLMLITRYMPLFSTLGTFVCGIPLAVLSARNGFKVILPTVLVTFVVSILINSNPISAISLMLMSCIPGCIGGYMLGRRKAFFVTLFSTCIAVCVGWLFQLVMLEMVIGTGIDEIFAETMEQIRVMMSGISDTIGEGVTLEGGITPSQMIDTLISSTEAIMRLYFPSFIVASSMITGYIIIRISGFVINRTKLAKVDVVPFSCIKAPRSMSVVSILVYTIYIFMSSKSLVYPVFANMVFILYMILGICGLSVVDFKFKMKIKSPAGRFGIYTLVFLFGGVFLSIISYILIFIGIMDAGRDFRQIGSQDA